MGDLIVPNGSEANTIQSPLTTTPLNTWEHIVAVYDGYYAKIYLNNTLVTSCIISPGSTTADSLSQNAYSSGNFSLTIGDKVLGTGYEFNYEGNINDVGIWNHALTKQDISALYKSCSNPISIITPQSSSSFCQGGSVILNASTGSNYTYQWYNNSQIINGETASAFQAVSSGNYTVKVTDGACNTTSIATSVTVNPNPIVSLNSLTQFILKTSSPIQLIGNPSGGSYSGDAVVGTTFYPANATLGKKTILYNYTDIQGCSGVASQNTIIADTVGNVCSTYDTLKIQVKFTAGLYANTVNFISFYPNPTNDILHIDNGNYLSMSGYSIKIISLTGSVIYNQPIVSQQVQISMNQFATKGGI